jgi:octaprenyl-diphosphate synthase
MKKLNQIIHLAHKDIENFNSLLTKLSYSDDKILNKILDYVFKDKGKQIRPNMVFLSAKIFGEVNRKTELAAVIVQLLHTSTLMHDDVVDEANIRRGKSTINSEKGNKIAVLVGDYLFSNALDIATKEKLFDILAILCPTISSLSIGEINQLEIAGTRKFCEEKYFEIIRAKTAVLIGASAEAGAVSVGVNDVQRDLIKSVGQDAGMAFQIQDDVLDFTADGVFGKAKCKDLEEKKYTLPLIHALDIAPKQESEGIIKMVEKGVDVKDINSIIEFIEKYDGIEYSKRCMEKYIESAEEKLAMLPQNEANKSVVELINYFTKRNK